MAIPSYGSWVTFPLEQHELVQLEWWSAKTQQRSKYYVDKAWFGRRININDYKDGLEVQGETLIFIAAEYIEPRMKGAPHLKHLHLADRMTHELSGQDPVTWGLFQLDEKFHYGQNNSQTFRWLVYHPAAIAGRERQMYQHRFVGNTYMAVADIGIELGSVAAGLATKGEVNGKGVATVLNRLKSVFAANLGHKLHQFTKSPVIFPVTSSNQVTNISGNQVPKRPETQPNQIVNVGGMDYKPPLVNDLNALPSVSIDEKQGDEILEIEDLDEEERDTVFSYRTAANRRQQFSTRNLKNRQVASVPDSNGQQQVPTQGVKASPARRTNAPKSQGQPGSF